MENNKEDRYSLNEDDGFEYNDWSAMFDKKHRGDGGEEEMHSIIFEAIEFSWVFRGNNAKRLIEYLKDVEEGANIFNVKTIQHVVMF